MKVLRSMFNYSATNCGSLGNVDMRVDPSSAFEMLERSAVKVARSVLRGVGNR